MYFTVLSYLQFCLSVIILTYLSNILHIYFARLHQYQNIFFLCQAFIWFSLSCCYCDCLNICFFVSYSLGFGGKKNDFFLK